MNYNGHFARVFKEKPALLLPDYRKIMLGQKRNEG